MTVLKGYIGVKDFKEMINDNSANFLAHVRINDLRRQAGEPPILYREKAPIPEPDFIFVYCSGKKMRLWHIETANKFKALLTPKP